MASGQDREFAEQRENMSSKLGAGRDEMEKIVNSIEAKTPRASNWFLKKSGAKNEQKKIFRII